MPDADVFPRLQSCTKLGTEHRIYDVKFYPYAIEDDENIFAAVGETDVYICRPKLDATPPYDVLRFFRDSELYDGEPASYNCLTWAKDPVTDKPLLCIAGSRPKHIKIIDVESGDVVRILSGHGRGVDDLVMSPLSDRLVVSAAEDGTIRFWDLRSEYEEQPCVALFGGEGHKQPILAIHFHPNGRWLLSGGLDCAVALWAVPLLEELERKGDQDTEPKIVYYPHFFSGEVHSNYVDCFAFYGDLIISRAAREPRDKTNEILIWRIVGFDSREPPPAEPAIPVIGQATRSAFPHDAEFRGFERVATLNMPNTARFYHRFGLFHQPGKRPLLVMGNQISKFHFFDLQKLDEGTDIRDEARARRGRGRGGRGRPPGRAADVARSDDGSRATPDTNYTTTPAPTERVLHLDDPFRPRPADYTVTANTKLSERNHFATSQITWSPDGTWVVGVGDSGMMMMFHRSKAAVDR